MAQINAGKVIVGGLAAGLVINVVESVMNLFVLTAAMDEALAARNLEPVGGAAIGGYVVLAFALGILVVWTYAAIRPRYGAGPGTALRAGAATWLAFYGLGGFAYFLYGMFSLGLFLTSLAYSLPMMLAAGYVGGMLYKEA